MPVFTNSELYAFNRDLDRYMAEETASELRAERVEAYANYLVEVGQECYPFTPAHVSEAFQEMSVVPLAVLAACLAEAESHKEEKDFLMLHYEPKDLSVPEVHRLLLGGVAPRPIALVSTISARWN